MVLDLLLALACSVPASLPGDDCELCAPAVLCPIHQSEQAAAIKELKPKLKSKEAGERSATLAMLAKLNAAHPSVPSAEIAELIANGLEDELYGVKSEAARLLSGGVHPEVAVRALVAALDQVRKDLGKMGGGGGRYGGPPDDNGKVDPNVAEQRRLRDEATKYALVVVDGLGRLPDDRCVEALADYLPQLSRRSGEEILNATAQGLLHFQARAGVAAVIEKIKLTPSGGGGGRWGPDTTGKTLHDLLVTFAQDQGLDGMPAWSDQEPPDWERWFAKNQKRFPAKLGKYDLERMREAAKS